MTNVHVSTNLSLTHGQSLTCLCEDDCNVDEMTQFHRHMSGGWLFATPTPTPTVISSVLSKRINLGTQDGELCVVCEFCVEVCGCFDMVPVLCVGVLVGVFLFVLVWSCVSVRLCVGVCGCVRVCCVCLVCAVKLWLCCVACER